MRDIDHIIIHCTKTVPEEPVGADEIDRKYRASGYWGNGYHYVIRRDGTIESDAFGHRCRPFISAGSHVRDVGPGWDKRSVGICMEGGKNTEGEPEDNFTDAQYASLKQLCRHLRSALPDAAIKGHDEVLEEVGKVGDDCPAFSVGQWAWENGFDGL